MIKDLYIEYIQKSRVFLYPSLNIKRGSSVTPIETYFSWDEHYTIADKKLICLYHLRDDNEFKTFERLKLLNNPKFENFHFVSDNKGVYIFDFSSDAEDYDNIINGKYSKISEPTKTKILGFFAQSKFHQEYIESYLYPQKYFDKYAELLASDDFKTMKQALEEAGELCPKPDFEREDLKIKLLELNVTKEV